MQRGPIYTLLTLYQEVFQLALHFMSKWTHTNLTAVDLMNIKKILKFLSKNNWNKANLIIIILTKTGNYRYYI